MGQISSKLRSGEGGLITYWCQGCEEPHAINSGWSFDGDLEAPTFHPSVLVTCGHYTPGFKPGSKCWCTFNAEHPGEEDPFVCFRCHTFIRGGIVEFLSDCTHALAGHTLPLPPLPPHLRD